jgi:hypothetical protein
VRTADVFAVIYRRRHAAAWRLFSLAPGVGGMAMGSCGADFGERVLRIVVAITAMLGVHLRRRAIENSHIHHPVPYGHCRLCHYQANAAAR